MLCKSENRDPAHCLKEGRKVTRCAQDLQVALSPLSSIPLVRLLTRLPFGSPRLESSISKVRSTCLKEFDAHWQCLERNNQVSCLFPSLERDPLTRSPLPLGILLVPKARASVQQLRV